MRLIEANFKAGNEARALQLAKEGIERDSSIAAQIGLVLLQNSCFPEAAVAFEKALVLAPASPDLTSKLAYAYLGANRPERAIELLKGFAGRQSSWQASFLLGQAYELTARPQEAIRYFRESIRLKPSGASIHYELGRVLANSADRNTQLEGAREMRRAIDLNPREAEYYIKLGIWFMDQGDLKSAVVLLTQGAENTKPSDDLYLLLGLAQYWQYGSASAVPTLQKAIELNPHNGLAYTLLGAFYFCDRDYGNALSYFQRATQEDPKSGLSFYGVASSLERLGRLDEAIPFAQKSIHLEPDSSRSHYLLGKIYANLDQNNEAVCELESVVRLDPKSESAYYLLARTYMRMNNPEKARQWSEKLQELTSKKRQAERAVVEDSKIPDSEPSDLSNPLEIWKNLRDSLPSVKPAPPIRRQGGDSN
jgi:tetratricopeptide (TPR) repeat protein